jgi:hypothetical protein
MRNEGKNKKGNEKGSKMEKRAHKIVPEKENFSD